MRLEPGKNRVVFKEIMNTKNKKNMKRHLQFYQWLLCLLLTMGSHLFAYSQGKVTCREDLHAGDVIKIYPYGHYDEASMALSCKGDGMDLTSYADAGKGSEWTLIDAGSGYYSLRNELGCYWAFQDHSSDHALTCTKDPLSAVIVKITWDSKNGGVCFWNWEDDRGLNNLWGKNNSYNWYSWSSDYDSNTKTTFEIKVKGAVFVAIDGIRYSLDVKHKTALVLKNNYVGDVVIPQMVSYNGNEFSVTSLDDGCFSNCSSLTSITLPKGITSVGDCCFYGCSSLTSITIPDGTTSLGERCFEGCKSLTSISFPSSLSVLYNNIFANTTQKRRIIIKNTIPPDIKISSIYSNLSPINSKYTLYVPKGTLDAYKKATTWGRAGVFYEGNPIDSITFPSNVSFAKTEKNKMTYSVLPIDANQECLKWSSDNSSIASIDEKTGVVTALKAGDATLTATVDDGSGISASTIVHVTPIKVSNIDMLREITLLQAQSVTLAATITPELADDKTLS